MAARLAVGDHDAGLQQHRAKAKHTDTAVAAPLELSSSECYRVASKQHKDVLDNITDMTAG